MHIDFDRAEMYLGKAQKDIEESDAEDALFHIRRSLETALEQINRSTGFKYQSLDNDVYIYRMIDDLRNYRLISANEATDMHRIRAISNKGVHGEFDENIGGMFVARDVFLMMEELLEELKKAEWDIDSLSRYNPKRKTHIRDKGMNISPFVPKI